MHALECDGQGSHDEVVECGFWILFVALQIIEVVSFGVLDNGLSLILDFIHETALWCSLHITEQFEHIQHEER